MRQRNAGISVADQWLMRLLTEQTIDYDARNLSSYKRLLIATIIELSNPSYRKQCRQLRDELMRCPQAFDPLLDMLFVAMVYGCQDPLAKAKEKPTHYFKVKMGAYPKQKQLVNYAGKHTLRFRMTSDANGKALLYALLRGLGQWSSSLLYHNGTKPYAHSAVGAVQQRVWMTTVAAIEGRVEAMPKEGMSALMLRSMHEVLTEALQHEQLLGHLLAAYAGQPTMLDLSGQTHLLREHFSACSAWTVEQQAWLAQSEASLAEEKLVLSELCLLAHREVALGGVVDDYMMLLLQFVESAEAMEPAAHERAKPSYYTVSEVVTGLRYFLRSVERPAVAPVAASTPVRASQGVAGALEHKSAVDGGAADVPALEAVVVQSM